MKFLSDKCVVWSCNCSKCVRFRRLYLCDALDGGGRRECSTWLGRRTASLNSSSSASSHSSSKDGRYRRWFDDSTDLKPGPHQQQSRSNVRLCCQKRQQWRTSFAMKFHPFDKVERCFDIVSSVDRAWRYVRQDAVRCDSAPRCTAWHRAAPRRVLSEHTLSDWTKRTAPNRPIFLSSGTLKLNSINQYSVPPPHSPPQHDND